MLMCLQVYRNRMPLQKTSEHYNSTILTIFIKVSIKTCTLLAAQQVICLTHEQTHE